VKPSTPPPVLEVVDLSKRFGAFRALDGVSLRVAPGTVHALLGENGAGKSTLVKCIMGYHRPDAGEVRLDGRAVTPASPRQAQALGLGMVYQHFTLVPNMTVAENLILARGKLPFFIDWARQRRELETFFQDVPFQLPLEAPVRTLAAGEKQKLEIAKQLFLQSRIVILDEPTSVLTPAEAGEVLGLLADMAHLEQRLSIVLITHKFREVSDFADEVTVLRRGQRAGGGPVARFRHADLADMMVGSRAPLPQERSTAKEQGPARLRVRGLSADDELGTPALREVSFEVRAGEIVGVAAVAGNGQEELVEVLAGQRQRTAGELEVAGSPYQGTRTQMRQRRMRCLPEEPLHSACVPAMSVAENMAFFDFDCPPYARFGWWLSPRALRERGQRLVEQFGVRTRSADSPLGELSGGNVQRVVLARELASQIDVLVAANPCMGLDFSAVAEVHARLLQVRDSGAAVLLVSADLDEIFALADRILVMSEGRVVHETPAASAQRSVLGAHMAGHA
jgi:general nucleoside transport system ATP-binding protein